MELKPNCKLNRNRKIESKIIKNQESFFRVSKYLHMEIQNDPNDSCFAVSIRVQLCPAPLPDLRSSRSHLRLTSQTSRYNDDKHCVHFFIFSFQASKGSIPLPHIGMRRIRDFENQEATVHRP